MSAVLSNPISMRFATGNEEAILVNESEQHFYFGQAPAPSNEAFRRTWELDPRLSDPDSHCAYVLRTRGIDRLGQNRWCQKYLGESVRGSVLFRKKVKDTAPQKTTSETTRSPLSRPVPIIASTKTELRCFD